MLYQSFVKNLLSEKRYEHSVNVALAAAKFAVKLNENVEKAQIAGILHDIAKEWSKEEHMSFIKKHGIKLLNHEFASKKLLHALTGSYYAKFVLKIKDYDIINAIRFHTTARKGMSNLEKIVYVSDFISAERSFEGVKKLRDLANKNFEAAFINGLIYSICELTEKKQIIHPDTFKAYNEFIFND
ncbi:MAG: bis(5'-nucleosyl)-tetraphosphatase (symmetrical) YqeK [Oscillospiraceae bacterium]|jgi:nicotinate-nucleotide adenylyltransferase|nr:bis(5'-nucleosyl)-tetraphosphatase (symmetrical) YqeK [Oscillospiraceae bacterium]